MAKNIHRLTAMAVTRTSKPGLPLSARQPRRSEELGFSIYVERQDA